MITVIAEIKVKPGHRETVLKAIEKLIPSVLAEEGCGGYQPLVDIKAQVPWKQSLPDSVFMLEKWESIAHLEKHLEMEHMHRHRATIKDSVLDVNIQVLEEAL
ncbi:Probable quinol monooxygenase ygiN [Serratia rubidaea]|uniref:Probable quinol monooxygenase ygiN n=1 Tax=Serratia rubidaea TaxID=61652 RepID=A0A447QJQ4_SERRU|nr:MULTISPECIES: putative quinol monooxygenase [Serratia]AGB84181.1 hypothetical protein D781_3991 [Serratia sp. FGI94]MBD8453755.1 antibiotic biosynthesis monooxygenase [Serratia rubidaea]MBS0974407.1 antibiotic biosynthesis monooxygenase [Serratia rubidaea]MCR0997690.1 antibiotic biosynthesis monooxygenase [Serratia rubidaea]MDC6109200.1 putative quinol monooxygenase [Serratia rubidaea]